MTPVGPSEQDDNGRPQSLEQRVQELETKVSTLLEDNKKLRATVAQQEEIIEQQEEIIAQQQETIAQQQETIARLRARLKWYENPNTPPSRRFPGGPDSPDTDEEDHDDQPPDGETDDEDTDGRSDTDEADPDAGERDGSSADPDHEDESAPDDSEQNTPGRNEGHEGTTSTLPDPDRTVRVGSACCGNCGRTLTDPDDFATQTVLDIPLPIPTEVVRYERGIHECSCGTTVTAEHSGCPPRGDYGPKLLTLVTLLRYHCRLPHRKQVALFDWVLDHDISHGSIHNFHDRVAEQLRPAYEEVVESVGQRDVVYADETGYPVDGDQHWLWAFVTDEEVLYHLADNRGSAVLEAVLGDAFDEDAVLGCDGWSAHNCFHSLLQRCWAHLLREAEYVAARYAEGEALSEELHAIFEEATEFVERDPSQAARERKRKAWSDRLEALATQEYEAEEVNKLGTKLDNGLGFWLTFVTHPGVDPTNNRAERAIREQVIMRKVFGGLRSERGTEIHEIITTMLATWQKRGLDPPEELISILGGDGSPTEPAASGEVAAEKDKSSGQAVEASP